MARSDLLLQLIESGFRGDKYLFQKAVEAVIAEERGKNHKIFADKIEESMRFLTANENKRSNYIVPNAKSEDRAENLFFEGEPNIKFSDLILNNFLRGTFADLLEEQYRSDILRSYGLEPRHRLLLIGPPGNGKTSIAEAIAYEAAVPFYSIKYEALIGSYLGETASRLKSLFDFIRTQRCVVFFDEFDTIGKERGDEHETGEIKRVVSSLLLQIDKLPSYVIIIAATNHPELLDKAVWRRFQLKVSVNNPTISEIEEFVASFERRFQIEFGVAPSTISKQYSGRSFSELKDFCLDVFRKYVLHHPLDGGRMKNIVSSQLINVRKSYKPDA